MSECVKLELIDLVEKFVYKEFRHWKSGIYIASICRDPDSYRIDMWSRAAGVLCGNKWYAWKEINEPLTPVYAGNPEFFNILKKDIESAFCRSGNDVYWLRHYPTR